jgi:hypothetical protein
MWDCYGSGIVFLPNIIWAVHIKFPTVDVNDVRCKYIYLFTFPSMFICFFVFVYAYTSFCCILSLRAC